MIKAQRHARILANLRAEGAASVNDLAEAIGVSASTVRRDLEHLTKLGYLKRTHGGAILPPGHLSTLEIEDSIATEFARREKEKIGAAAAAIVEDGQSVIFDSSSTVMEAARALVSRRVRLTAITNSLSIGQFLARSPNITTIVLGGTTREGSLTLVGEPGREFLQTFHADMAFLGTHAISEDSLTETSLEVASIKRAMIAAARRVVVLADSSKFQRPALVSICGVGDIHQLITDDGADPEAISALRDRGLSITVVPADPSSHM